MVFVICGYIYSSENNIIWKQLLLCWDWIGMILESYGFIVPFRFALHKFTISNNWINLTGCNVADSMYPCSGFWPTLTVFLQRIPILGWLFQQPYVRSVSLSFFSYSQIFWILASEPLVTSFITTIRLTTGSMKMMSSSFLVQSWLASSCFDTILTAGSGDHPQC